MISELKYDEQDNEMKKSTELKIINFSAKNKKNMMLISIILKL